MYPIQIIDTSRNISTDVSYLPMPWNSPNPIYEEPHQESEMRQYDHTSISDPFELHSSPRQTYSKSQSKKPRNNTIIWLKQSLSPSRVKTDLRLSSAFIVACKPFTTAAFTIIKFNQQMKPA
ncbi:hypothetical protein SDJN02_18949, partial [Cucurbita argyrosperma subsp. argyrosperma]